LLLNGQQIVHAYSEREKKPTELDRDWKSGRWLLTALEKYAKDQYFQPYSSDIVESGVKYHNTNPSIYCQI
jgi:hypothetical protein